MELKDLLAGQGYDPTAQKIVLLRHRPYEANLARVMPWLISERADLFEAYQSVPGRPQSSLRKADLVISFLGLRPGTAHFIGLYQVGDHHPIDVEGFWAQPENQALRELGYDGLTEEYAEKAGTVLQFDFELLPFYPEWRGKLVINFPPPERSWFRWLHNGTFPVRAINEESAFAAAPPTWSEIDLGFAELAVLPTSWRQRLAEWRGIYLVFDERDGKSYVGSAAGSENLLGRWMSYGQDGHGGNRELRKRDPGSFRFTILERLAPDLPTDEVIAREANWKSRLHTRMPFGLNAN